MKRGSNTGERRDSVRDVIDKDDDEEAMVPRIPSDVSRFHRSLSEPGKIGSV